MDELRADGYRAFRNPELAARSNRSALLSFFNHHTIQSVKVEKGSEAANKTLKDLNLRAQYQVSVMSIRRKKETIPNPDGTVTLLPNDIVIVLGNSAALEAAKVLFKGG